MHFLTIASVKGMRLGLITVSGIRALIIDLHHHTCSDGEPIRGKPVTLGRDVPALAATLADAGDYTGLLAVDSTSAKVVAAGIGEVVRCRKPNAMIACG